MSADLVPPCPECGGNVTFHSDCDNPARQAWIESVSPWICNCGAEGGGDDLWGECGGCGEDKPAFDLAGGVWCETCRNNPTEDET